jgi:hypothetical protein
MIRDVPKGPYNEATTYCDDSSTSETEICKKLTTATAADATAHAKYTTEIELCAYKQQYWKAVTVSRYQGQEQETQNMVLVAGAGIVVGVLVVLFLYLLRRLVIMFRQEWYGYEPPWRAGEAEKEKLMEELSQHKQESAQKLIIHRHEVEAAKKAAKHEVEAAKEAAKQLQESSNAANQIKKLQAENQQLQGEKQKPYYQRSRQRESDSDSSESDDERRGRDRHRSSGERRRRSKGRRWS